MDESEEEYRLEHGVALVRAYLATAPAREREVMERILLRGQEPRAVARSMRIPIVAVRRHLARAQRAIRESATIARALPYLRMTESPRKTAEDRVIARLDRRRQAGPNYDMPTFSWQQGDE